MSYHPIMGITIFVIFLIIAFYIGKGIKTSNIKNNIKQKKINADSISPDAHWLKCKDGKYK